MSRRTERIAKLFQHEIGRIILTELADPRIDPARTSVTRVTVQEDLLRAKVYISVLGTDAEQRRVMDALSRAVGRIQSSVIGKVSLRHMPALEFHTDEQFKGALETWDVIREAMDEIHARERDQAGVAGDGEDDPEPNVQDRT